MRKNAILLPLALAAAVCIWFAADHAWIRIWTRWHVDRLSASDRSVFSASFSALAYDADARIDALLLSELARQPSKETYYQIVRVLYTRCGIQYAPEDVKLPSVEALRSMVKEKYADSGRRKPW
jgi:hypothetical protein